ncbi:16S rRNA (cytosine(1402)-N(4))-methyltransferase [hydrothermal vent metagenome]|uniref:16S rRNA (Cytosine(1402)-N(4))-methyltransferase n=1 Tax=hydrothermal vent metagenome TaxID=652676 RepID=A0A3B0U3C2_9ZZZZ
MSTYHIPVMLFESVDGLSIRPGGDYVDATFGGGGHSREILRRLNKGRLFAFDQDADAARNAINDDRFFFIMHNFRFLKNFLRYFEVQGVDGILGDLGVSSHDFDVAERGFSFRFEGKLDMRMNRQAKKSAATVVNEYSEEELKQVFRTYGEVRNAAKLAHEIVQARATGMVETTQQLRSVIDKCIPKSIENKYMAQVFQALRIEVNREMQALKEFLEASLEVLKPGGRLVMITYHSLEDRLVKNFMKTGNFEGKVEKDFYGNVSSPFKLVNRKVVTPSAEELEKNPRSRSAKMRIAEKV